jgi:TrmH family RNA methyltransferase
VSKIFFSKNSVDIYNPKTVSAAKGSLFRMQCVYVDLKELFKANQHLKVYGTFMAGENIFETALNKNSFIIIGNEANGISDELLAFITNKISIPNFGKAESLNAAVAAGIVLSEFRR